jgi:hypothetical protein
MFNEKIIKTKEKYFVSICPRIAYEMNERRNLGEHFSPQDLLQEKIISSMFPLKT